MSDLDWEKHRRRKLARRRKRGEECEHAKLDEEKVRALRSENLNLHECARFWGVCRKTLRDARDGKTWAHVPMCSRERAA